jgi:putative tricarboxylic transport membrane protein
MIERAVAPFGQAARVARVVKVAGRRGAEGRMKHAVADRLFAVCILVGAVGYLLADIQITGLDTAGPVGPRVFPAIVAVGLFVSGAFLLLETLRPEPKAEKRFSSPPASHSLILVAMALWTAAYYAVFEPLGYVVSTIFYMFPLLIVFNRKQMLVNLVIAVGFSLAAYGLFAKFLGVAMPGGIISF